MKTITTAITSLALFAPLAAFAQTTQTTTSTLGRSLRDIIVFIDVYLVPIIFAIAFVVFLWGVVQYFIIGGGSEEKRKEGKQFILYGIIGFVIMISIWGIVRLVSSSLGLERTRPALPCFSGDNCNSTGGANNNQNQPNWGGNAPMGT